MLIYVYLVEAGRTAAAAAAAAGQRVNCMNECPECCSCSGQGGGDSNDLKAFSCRANANAILAPLIAAYYPPYTHGAKPNNTVLIVEYRYCILMLSSCG